MMSLLRIFFIFVLIEIAISCNFLSNSIREYDDKTYTLDTHSMQVLSKKHNGLRVTEVFVFLIDSISKQHKTVLIQDSLDDLPDVYNLLKESSYKDSIRNNYSKILLQTERHKTNYTVSLAPSDWSSRDKIYFTKNVW